MINNGEKVVEFNVPSENIFHGGAGIRVLFLYANERGMSTVPPAIALLSQILKMSGHSTSIFDTTFYKFDDELAVSDSDEVQKNSVNVRPFEGLDDDNYIKTTKAAIQNFRSKVLEFQPDLIAASTTETTFHRAVTLISGVRDLRIPNIFGGVFCTFAPELVMSFKEVDMCCVGEGENTIVDLAAAISRRKDLTSITNLVIRDKDGSLIKNSITRPVDIDSLPDITDIGIFGEKRFYRPMGGKIRRLLPVETHRGCPYSCSFCNSPSQNRLYGSGFFRKKSLELVKNEIENHVKNWNVEYIFFWADTLLAWSTKEFDAFIEMYSDIKLPFWCQTRIETITYQKMAKLKDVGLDRITFGMEHGNESFRRDVIKREYSNELAIQCMKIPDELDITFSVNNIIGFPDETRELAFDTIELNRHFNSDSLSCSVFVPFHGTELRTYSERKGYIDHSVICNVNQADKSMLDMPQWPKEDIARLRSTFAMYVKYPRIRWPEIKKAEQDPDRYEKLAEEFREMCWADPRAKIEDDLAEAAKGIF